VETLRSSVNESIASQYSNARPILERYQAANNGNLIFGLTPRPKMKSNEKRDAGNGMNLQCLSGICQTSGKIHIILSTGARESFRRVQPRRRPNGRDFSDTGHGEPIPSISRSLNIRSGTFTRDFIRIIGMKKF